MYQDSSTLGESEQLNTEELNLICTITHLLCNVSGITRHRQHGYLPKNEIISYRTLILNEFIHIYKEESHLLSWQRSRNTLIDYGSFFSWSWWKLCTLTYIFSINDRVCRPLSFSFLEILRKWSYYLWKTIMKSWYRTRSLLFCSELKRFSLQRFCRTTQLSVEQPIN